MKAICGSRVSTLYTELPPQAEKDFFANATPYTHIAARQGTLYLSKKLNSILEDHIRACMPEIGSRIKVMLRDAQDELQQYGDDDARAYPLPCLCPLSWCTIHAASSIRACVQACPCLDVVRRDAQMEYISYCIKYPGLCASLPWGMAGVLKLCGGTRDWSTFCMASRIRACVPAFRGHVLVS